MFSVFYLLYTTTAIVSFIAVDNSLDPSKDPLKEWLDNFKVGCEKELDMTFALQNASLNSCAYITLPWATYILTMYRN